MHRFLSLLILAAIQCSVLLGAKVTVTTAQELTDAINDAAANATEPTKIIIVGTLQGTFFVPKTNYPIYLIGKKGTYPTLDAQSQGTTLTVDLGATVIVKHLSIINGVNYQQEFGGGIVNLGSTELAHCTIRNNTSSSENYYALLFGGGIFNNNWMKIRKCLITENEADRGGGIYNRHTMTIVDSQIVENTLSVTPRYCYGAGIFNDGYLKVLHSSISDNNGTNGYAGGIYTEGKMYIKNSKITDNYAYQNCGGIENDIFLKIENCEISGNRSAVGRGAGVYNDYGDLVIKCSSIHNNITDSGDGGGIFNAWNLKIECSSIRDNLASDGDGGGIYNDWQLIIKNSSITGNQAPAGDGGGIFNDGDSGEFIDPSRFITITCSEIEGNSARFGGGISNESGALLEMHKTLITKNIATDGIGAGGGLFTPEPSIFYATETDIIDNILDNVAPE